VYVNRSAGRKAADPALIGGLLYDLGVQHVIHTPGSSDETTSHIQAAAATGARHFAIAGGDGTVNLAVNALMALDLDERPVIGVLPVGTGCDLLRTFGLPQDLARAAQHLLTDDVYAIDVATLEGTWGTRHFVNVAQAGVGAAAAQTAQRLARRLGSARYSLAFAGRLPAFPRARVTVTTERRTIEADALAVILANAQFFAGGWNVAPRATLMDGILDVQIIDIAKTSAPALVPKVIKGTHLSDRSVRRLTAAEFSVTCDPVWPLECDGDLVGNTPVTGRVIPAAVSLKI
jgi:YegS/Rv2252/BmrU family lipid kinase